MSKRSVSLSDIGNQGSGKYTDRIEKWDRE